MDFSKNSFRNNNEPNLVNPIKKPMNQNTRFDMIEKFKKDNQDLLNGKEFKKVEKPTDLNQFNNLNRFKNNE